MRILSQDGMSDFPYNEVGLSIGCKGDKSEFYIFCHHKLQDNGVKIATYSTAENAQKAMDMLRKTYSPILVIDNVSDEHIKADIKPFITPLRAGKPNVEVLDNFYFQFPADDEIEV